MDAPKLFISYSWSSPEHEQWVINLATELCESGVDVILDKWDLKEGYDANAFMEQMVSDPQIKKVAMICDKKYAEKANSRSGGVGTEAQIISKEVYERQDQNKFVAVITEKDENGKPFLPIYYGSRKYIDLSEPDRYAGNFEQLLRWIYDKPLYVKPEIGSTPAFLSKSEHVSLSTTAQFNRCVDAIRNNKAYAVGAFNEYCTLFATNLERFRLSKPEEEFDDAVVKNIEEFLPYRNEFLQLLITIAQYSPNEEFMQHIHHLFESLLPYLDRPADVTRWSEMDFDNFRFIIHELFLYSLAIFLKYERFDQTNVLLQQPYYLSANAEYGRDVIVSFVIFERRIRSLDDRNRRLKLGRLSVRADLLKGRCNGTGIDFQSLMQADFVAYMRSEVDAKDGRWRWWPETIPYFEHFNRVFEIFARSISKRYFDRAKVILNINSPKDLEPIFKGYQDRSRSLPSLEFAAIDPIVLMGYEHLAAQP